MTKGIKMVKVVLNISYGGFRIPEDLRNELCLDADFGYEDEDRTCPELVAAIEKHGGRYGDLAIAHVPDGVKWFIGEYDGKEWVAEQHRTWFAENGGEYV